MCYSAQVTADYRKLHRDYGAEANWPAVREVFWRRVREGRRTQVRMPKALELAFEHPSSKDEEDVKKAILEYRQQQTHFLEQELFKQRKRLADAQRKLKTKSTKAALEDERIATEKSAQLERRIADVNRTQLEPRDTWIYPFSYCLIVLDEGDGLQIVPARYHCRTAGSPALFDRKLPGLYNARRDSLTTKGMWKPLFGKTHAIMQIHGFKENVAIEDYEHRKLKPGEESKNLVIGFSPRPAIDMTVACLWSRWKGPGEPELLSFAAVTDTPTPEIAAAGHNRAVVMLKPAQISTWLHPQGHTLDEFQALFDDREQPHFEFRIAA